MFLINFLFEWSLFDILYGIALWLDFIAFSAAKLAYTLFYSIVSLPTLDLNSALPVFDKLISRMNLFIGLFIAYKIIVILINYLINPDGFSKDTSVSKIVLNFFLTIIMLIGSPFVFDLLDEGQAVVLGTKSEESVNIISRFILGKGASDGKAKDVNKVIGNIYVGFFRQGNNVVSCNSQGIFPSDPLFLITQVCDDGDFSRLYDNSDFKDKIKISGESDGDVSYNYPIISTLTGVVLVILFLEYSLDAGVRLLKLSILKVIAPLAFISYIDPKTKKTFDNFVKEYSTTYFSIFINCMFIFLAVACCNSLTTLGEYLYALTGGTWLLIFICICLFYLGKELPKIVSNIFGIEIPSWKNMRVRQLGDWTGGKALALGGTARNFFRDFFKGSAEYAGEGFLKRAGGAVGAAVGGLGRSARDLVKTKGIKDALSKNKTHFENTGKTLGAIKDAGGLARYVANQTYRKNLSLTYARENYKKKNESNISDLDGVINSSDKFITALENNVSKELYGVDKSEYISSRINEIQKKHDQIDYMNQNDLKTAVTTEYAEKVGSLHGSALEQEFFKRLGKRPSVGMTDDDMRSELKSSVDSLKSTEQRALLKDVRGLSKTFDRKAVKKQVDDAWDAVYKPKANEVLSKIKNGDVDAIRSDSELYSALNDYKKAQAKAVASGAISRGDASMPSTAKGLKDAKENFKTKKAAAVKTQSVRDYKYSSHKEKSASRKAEYNPRKYDPAYTDEQKRQAQVASHKSDMKENSEKVQKQTYKQIEIMNKPIGNFNFESEEENMTVAKQIEANNYDDHEAYLAYDTKIKYYEYILQKLHLCRDNQVVHNQRVLNDLINYVENNLKRRRVAVPEAKIAIRLKDKKLYCLYLYQESEDKSINLPVDELINLKYIMDFISYKFEDGKFSVSDSFRNNGVVGKYSLNLAVGLSKMMDELYIYDDPATKNKRGKIADYQKYQHALDAYLSYYKKTLEFSKNNVKALSAAINYYNNKISELKKERAKVAIKK